MFTKIIGYLKAQAGIYTANKTFTRLLTVLSIDILVRLSNIILLPVYLRLMTQEEYGLYNYILSIVTTFSVILNFGLYVSQTKYYSDATDVHQRRIVLFNIFILLTALTVLVLCPIYMFGWDYYLIRALFKNDINYQSFRWPMLLAIVVSVYTVILANYFISSERIKDFRKFNLFRLIVVNIVVLACLYFFKKDKIRVRLLYTYIAEMSVLLVFFTFYLRQMVPEINRRLMFSYLKLGIPIMFSAIWGLISNYSDKFFLEKYGTARDLSYYYLAFSLANMLYMICMAAQNVWMPTFLKEKTLAVNISRTRKLLKKLVYLLLALGCLLMIALFVAIRIHVISDKYTPALYILPLLMLAQILNGVVLIYSTFLIYFEKTHWSLFIGIIASCVGLCGSYLLVPVWGVAGAALVYLVVQAFYLLLNHLFIQYQIKKMVLASNPG